MHSFVFYTEYSNIPYIRPHLHRTRRHRACPLPQRSSSTLVCCTVTVTLCTHLLLAVRQDHLINVIYNDIYKYRYIINMCNIKRTQSATTVHICSVTHRQAERYIPWCDRTHICDPQPRHQAHRRDSQTHWTQKASSFDKERYCTAEWQDWIVRVW